MSYAQWQRQLMVWELYNGTFIEMYVNPQNVTFTLNKKITPTRTKGGFIVQYWGDELEVIQMNGTTGSSGIEGMEILNDLYRSEQLGDSGMANLQSVYSRLSTHQHADDTHKKLSGSPPLSPEWSASKARSTDLVARATQVVLWYGKKRYYGIFTNFSITEAAAHPGEYIYSLSYSVWKTYGRDVNYMPWHRSNRVSTQESLESWSVSEHPLMAVNITPTPGASGGDYAVSTPNPVGFWTSPKAQTGNTPAGGGQE